MASKLQDLESRIREALRECAAWTETVDALIQIVADRPIEDILAAAGNNR